MSAAELVLGILGVWRISHLLHAEDGPGNVIVTLRRALGSSVAGKAMDCLDCLSLWVAMPFAVLIGDGWREVVLAWPALSAAAMIVHRAVNGLRPPAAAVYLEDPLLETADVQLRQGARERGAGDDGESGGETGGDRTLVASGAAGRAHGGV